MPYWRLSSFYFFHFASLGVLLPYWSLYLKYDGFSSREIGELMAVLMATKIIAPNIWGWIADHWGRRMQIVRGGSLLALICFVGVFAAGGYWQLAAAMFAFSFFWNAVLPQFEATTFTYLSRDPHRYSMIRLWGSVGFIVAVAGVGGAIDTTGPALLPWVLLALFAAIWFSTLVVPEGEGGARSSDPTPLKQILARPAVLALLAASFFMQASHGPYYTFYTIYLEDYGYSGALIGWLWALGVIAEVGIFLVMHRLMPRHGLRALLLAAFALTTVRWVTIGLFPQSLTLLLLAQLLHAASFGIFHAAAIALIHRFFAGRHHGKGQAFYSSVSFGAGGAVGSLFAGNLWDLAGPAVVFSIGAALSAAGYLVVLRWIKEE